MNHLRYKNLDYTLAIRASLNSITPSPPCIQLPYGHQLSIMKTRLQHTWGTFPPRRVPQFGIPLLVGLSQH